MKEMHKKVWGYEEWLANSERYCGKRLFVKEGYRSSLHYHLIKDETFYISRGKMRLEYYAQNDYTMSDKKETILKKGDSFHVPVGMAHRFTSLNGLEFFEFSSQHMESDSHRIEMGGKVKSKRGRRFKTLRMLIVK